MSSLLIKINGPQLTVNATPNTVPINDGTGATMIRVINTGIGLANVTIANAGSNTGSIQMFPNTESFIKKYPGDTIVASNNTTIFATPIGLEW